MSLETTSPRQIKRLSSSQENKIGALLYSKLRSTTEGYSVYSDGWSDERIAAEVDCDVRSVKYRREKDSSFAPLKDEPRGHKQSTHRLEELILKHNAFVEFIAKRISNGNTELLRTIHEFRL